MVAVFGLSEWAEEFDAFFGSIQPLFVDNFLNQQFVSVSEKGMGELVSRVDLAVQERLVAHLEKRFAHVRVASEEMVRNEIELGSESCWVLDPLDGTHNFLAGIPLFGVMATLVEDGQLRFATVFLPIERALGRSGVYVAGRGAGAWEWSNEGSNRLSVSSQHELKKAFLLLEGKSTLLAASGAVQRLIAATRRNRNNLGACWTLTRLASARRYSAGVDVALTLGNALWDNLPACLFIEEAGGKVTDYNGNPWSVENCRDLICSNGLLHQEALKIMKGE